MGRPTTPKKDPTPAEMRARVTETLAAALATANTCMEQLRQIQEIEAEREGK